MFTCALLHVRVYIMRQNAAYTIAGLICMYAYVYVPQQISQGMRRFLKPYAMLHQIEEAVRSGKTQTVL